MISSIIWNSEKISNFVLGTAQLGLAYGIGNTKGKPELTNSKKILAKFEHLNGNCIDTAHAYGDSEKVIGKLTSTQSTLKIISKLSPEISLQSPDNWISGLNTSLDNLNKKHIWAVLNHRQECIKDWSQKHSSIIKRMKSSKKISYFGVSIYDTKEAKKALDIDEIDCIQIPCNIWDQRMLREGIFETAKQKNKLCFVRSIYLQGALLLSEKESNKKLPFASTCFSKWYNLLRDHNLTAKNAALSFALSLNSPLVIGAETENQIEENISLFNINKMNKTVIDHFYNHLNKLITTKIINPSLW